ncbi:MAG: hypothetical protein GC160_12935 [Acidobacteria bacterium]|nr:hypothetical protein [Acidobacteriota bacterium]
MRTRSICWAFALALALLPAAPLVLSAKNPATPAEAGVMDMDGLLAAYPNNVRMLLENDHVWVYEVRLAPGERLGTHRTGDFFLYALTDAKLLMLPNYEPELLRLRAGQARWFGFEPHDVINRGAKEARYLVVARHSSPLPATPVEHGCPLAEVAPAGTAKVLLDNRNGRVTEVMLPAGTEQPRHCGLNRVVYSLNAYEIAMDGREGAFGAGMTHFHEADNHAVRNIGATPAHYLVFELKR